MWDLGRRRSRIHQDVGKGVGRWRGCPDDSWKASADETERIAVASKDKGGKSEKKAAKKNLKEKRAEKKQKKK